MKVPNFDDPELTKFLVQWDLELQRMKRDQLSAISGNRSLLLYSPNASVFEITVSDLGVITATKVAG
jgi:hypothetical protein